MTIRPDLTVNDLVRRRADALPTLAALGIDTCCGGGDSLALAAARAGLTFDQLLRRLEDPGAHEIPPAPGCGCGSRHP
jgi:iron-sulfur cluster repair protein YtfE (RIC family)